MLCCLLALHCRCRPAHDGLATGHAAGRSLSLLDPTYASKYIPIIASVSEHQPPSWPSYFTDLQARAQPRSAGPAACARRRAPMQGPALGAAAHWFAYRIRPVGASRGARMPLHVPVFLLIGLPSRTRCALHQEARICCPQASDRQRGAPARTGRAGQHCAHSSSTRGARRSDEARAGMRAQAATLLMPAGLIAMFRPLTHASLFLILYGVTAIYFSGVMVRALVGV